MEGILKSITILKERDREGEVDRVMGDRSSSPYVRCSDSPCEDSGRKPQEMTHWRTDHPSGT